MITFFALLGSYWLVRGWLDEHPYSSGMRDLTDYLWNLSVVKARDLVIFSCLTLTVVLIAQHSMGFASWLILFMKTP